jgi:hypothetical protein
MTIKEALNLRWTSRSTPWIIPPTSILREGSIALKIVWWKSTDNFSHWKITNQYLNGILKLQAPEIAIIQE